jgi:antitoxin (DNA-binding transcriptional repressor) of toxin-antitoxin stability system
VTTTLEIGTITQSVPELVDRLAPGDELILTRNQQPVGRLTGGDMPSPSPEQHPPAFGWMAGVIEYMAPDFDEPLEDMKEYME